ncbi:unnamed protein product [Phytomonas sp. EM1]|nr:unnamed protein product [Phytomonas sp. EM1]|eukprot:CCW63032.1 unnamed protein product [Phytomonas sp. isolate EM1]
MTNNTLPYDVVYCSSQDPRHPISNILGRIPVKDEEQCVESPLISGGWQSEKNCKTAQMLVLRFSGNVWLHQLKIIMHEIKIASRVEISVFKLQGEAFVEPPSFKLVNFQKLGTVNFNCSEQPVPRTKERKTVYLKTEAYFVKILFDQVFTSNLNKHNQVGIYSIECVGRLLTFIPFHADATVVNGVNVDSSSLDLLPSEMRSTHNLSRNGSRPADFELSSGRNTPCVRQSNSSGSVSHQMHSLKDVQYHQGAATSMLSVPSSTLPGASTQIQSFRSVRIVEFEEFFLRRLEELFSLKEQAVAVNDFDTATKCEEKLLDLNKASRTVYRLEQCKVQAIIEEDFNRAEETKKQMDDVVEGVYKTLDMPMLQCKNYTYALSLSTDKMNESASADQKAIKADAVTNRVICSDKLNDPTASASASRDGELARGEDGHDIRDMTSTTVDRDAFNPYDQQEFQLFKDDVEESSKVLENAICSLTGEGENDEGFPADSSLDTRALRKSLGPYVAACLVSRNFKLREGALLVVTEHISTTLRSSAAAVADAVLRFLDFNSFGLQDPIPNVVFAACNFVRKSLADECHCISKYLPSLLNLLPRLLCRASETNPRMRSEIMMTLQLYIQVEKVPDTAIFQAILADPIDREKRKVPFTNPRPQIVRLNMLKFLLSAGRLTLPSAGGVNLTRKLLLPAVNHQSPEVRDTATALYTSLVSLKCLPVKKKDLINITNSGIRQAIQAASES